MNTYRKVHFNQISEILMHAALGVSAVCGHKFVTSDMVHSLSDFNRVSYEQNMKPYYIAIREMGTESGYKEHCIERCKGLGYPIIIAKIERDEVYDYNMTITFTSGWMDKDNNHMEQEFNSL